MTAFVLDSSATLAWHFPDERHPVTDQLGEVAAKDGVLVPDHWFAEVANSLRTAERRGRTSADLVARFFTRLDSIEITTDPADADLVFGRVMPLARAHRLTVYDAIYLELAERSGLPLATLDSALAQAGRHAGIVIYDRESPT